MIKGISPGIETTVIKNTKFLTRDFQSIKIEIQVQG